MLLRTWVLLVGLAVVPGAALAETDFPYDSELIMDVAPMRGSERIPNMDVDSRGMLDLQMWCNRVQGQFVVAAHTVTVLTRAVSQQACPPERAQGDEQLLTALSQVTTWRRRGDTFELIGGPRILRFRLPTN